MVAQNASRPSLCMGPPLELAASERHLARGLSACPGAVVRPTSVGQGLGSPATLLIVEKIMPEWGEDLVLADAGGGSQRHWPNLPHRGAVREGRSGYGFGYENRVKACPLVSAHVRSLEGFALSAMTWREVLFSVEICIPVLRKPA